MNPQLQPRDAKLISLLLASLGVSEVDPLVIHQLLELAHRHILDILQDAQIYSEHADRKDLSLNDLKLAVESKVLDSFISPPSKDLLYEIAEKKNNLPLPQIPEKFGLRLPPERHILTAPTLNIAVEKTLGKTLMDFSQISQSESTKKSNSGLDSMEFD
jgi:transcription initiation factor TFIID subunit 9B